MNRIDSQPTTYLLPENDPLLAEALKEYMAALQAGETPDREKFTARFPGIAAQLRDQLAGLEFIERAASLLRESDSDDDPSQPVPERMLGDFHIVREIGRGGMGVVYEAVQVSLGRRVALKVLPHVGPLDAKRLQRFKNEAHAAAQLHHGNIVPVYGVGCEHGWHFFAMQYIEGQTLAAALDEIRREAGLVDSEGSLPTPVSVTYPEAVVGNGVMAAHPALAETIRATSKVSADDRCGGRPDTEWMFRLSTAYADRNGMYFRTAARIAIEAALALEHAHQLGVIHRDIKPGNLMVDYQGHVWVTDFGLARLPHDTGLTMTGDVVGTLRYMSPEQALAKRGLLDQRTDVYSLGVTLYELLTLQPAFSSIYREEVLQQIAFEEPTPPRRLNPAIPVDLETILLKAMTKEPAGRYQTAQDLADDLQRFLDDRPVQARRPRLMQKVAKWQRRHRAVVSATLLMAMLGLAFGAWFFWRGQFQTEIQRRRAEEEWRRAEDRTELARQALDQMYEQSQRWFSSEPWGASEQASFLSKAREFYRELAPIQEPSRIGRHRSAEAYHRIAQIDLILSHPKEAEPSVERALGSLHQLVKEFPEDPQLRRDLANCQITCGEMLMDLGRSEEAVADLMQAARSLEQLLTGGPASPKEREELGRCQYRLGVFLAPYLQWYQDADRAFRRAQEVFAKLATEGPVNPDYLNHLAAVQVQRGKLLQQVRDFAQAERMLRQGLASLQKLTADSMLLPEFRQELGTAYDSLGTVLWQTERPAEAENAFRMAQSAYEKLVETFPHVARYQGYLAGTQASLVEVLRKKGDLKAARQLAEAAIHRTEVALRAANRTDFRVSLQKLYRQLALACIDQGEYAQAANAGENVADILNYCPWGAEYAMQIFAALPRVVDKAGVLDSQRRELVQKYLAREKGLRQEVLKRGYSAYFLNEVAWHAATFPDGRVRDPGEAVALAEKAVALAEKEVAEKVVAEKAVTPEARKRLAQRAGLGGFCNTLGVARYRQGNWKGAVADLEKAVQLNDGTDATDFFFLAMAHWRIGEKGKARQDYRKGLRVWERNSAQWRETWQPFRAEAESLLQWRVELVSI